VALEIGSSAVVTRQAI
jgi:CRISPR/Cas system-associated endonuclease Cas1